VEPGIILITDVAGLRAAFSKAAGEVISMLSEKEMFEQRCSAACVCTDQQYGGGRHLYDRVVVNLSGI